MAVPVRYYLDTEFNGWGGELMSLALVAENGDEFYVVLDFDCQPVGWVEANVLPYLDHVPEPLRGPRVGRSDAAEALAAFLAADPRPEIVADWPEDLAQFANLLLVGPGLMVQVPPLAFRLVPLPNYSVAQNSAVPHNALHDARALRDHLEMIE